MPHANICACMQDGYHYSIADLQKMDNPEDKIYRRGAPDTFDAAGLKRDLGRIRNGDEEIVSMPGFDHAKGDPEPDAHAFLRNEHKIVICEGLYLVHDDDGWEGISSLFDVTIFISSDVDVCIDRLKIRNKCIPGYTPEEIEFRCDAVDRVNANTVMRSINHADVVVESAAALVAKADLEIGNAAVVVEDDDEPVTF
jgi:pantothenate kinase